MHLLVARGIAWLGVEEEGGDRPDDRRAGLHEGGGVFPAGLPKSGRRDLRGHLRVCPAPQTAPGSALREPGGRVARRGFLPGDRSVAAARLERGAADLSLSAESGGRSPQAHAGGFLGRAICFRPVGLRGRRSLQGDLLAHQPALRARAPAGRVLHEGI